MQSEWIQKHTASPGQLGRGRRRSRSEETQERGHPKGLVPVTHPRADLGKARVSWKCKLEQPQWLSQTTAGNWHLSGGTATVREHCV